MSDGGSSSPPAAEGGEGAPDPASSSGYRGPEERPVLKLSVYLIDTYKHINRIYYEARARIKQQEEASGGADRGGVHNNGWDDAHYDYIVQAEEVIHGRYMLKHRIGKVGLASVGWWLQAVPPLVIPGLNCLSPSSPHPTPHPTPPLPSPKPLIPLNP